MKTRAKLFLFILVPFFFPVLTWAATISLTPASGAFAVGQTFSVGIVVDSSDQALNAVSGTLTFPADKLAVSSLSKGGSIIGLWVQEPSFDNAAGTVSFEGVALNPGFTGAAGRVLGVNFRVKSAGEAKLAFSTPAVLANDGQGTNILTTIGSANFQLTGQAASQPPPPTPVNTEALNISSPTHPDPNHWYQATTAQLVWDLPEGARAVRLLVSPSADSVPNVSYAPAISEKTVTDLADGVSYFAAQVKTADGWGPVAHFRLQIDTTPPASLSVREEPRADIHDPEAKLILEAADALSGIDHYEFTLDGRALPPWRGAAGERYLLSALELGAHTVTTRVFDRAGNYLDAVPLSVSVEAPPPSPWWRWGNQAVAAFSVAVPLVALLVLLGFLLEHSQRALRRLRRKVRQEVDEAEETIGKAFDALREDFEKQLTLLERAKSKRELTSEERRLLTRVRKNLRLAEKYIKKEVADIQAETK